MMKMMEKEDEEKGECERQKVEYKQCTDEREVR